MKNYILNIFDCGYFYVPSPVGWGWVAMPPRDPAFPNGFRSNNIEDSPYKELLKKAKKENEKPNSSRIVAGFCWPWSKHLSEDGSLVKDVRIGDFEMPWETHDNVKPPPGYVKWFQWAYLPEGFKQVGCIYTAQGFEFDYVGVIIGEDLIYDKDSNCLSADISATKDPMLSRSSENFEFHVKNIYRTLLSRGMKGCYVYFVDKETEKFFKDRMEMG